MEGIRGSGLSFESIHSVRVSRLILLCSFVLSLGAQSLVIILLCTKAEFDNSFHTASMFAFGKLMARCVSTKKSPFFV